MAFFMTFPYSENKGKGESCFSRNRESEIFRLKNENDYEFLFVDKCKKRLDSIIR